MTGTALVTLALALGTGIVTPTWPETGRPVLSGPVLSGPVLSHTVSSHLAAEPQVPSGRFTTATEVRPILSATKSSWVSLREFDGQDLLYVTHLWSWRCGLVELKIGINGALPRVWPLPACHSDSAAPNAITTLDGLPYVRFPLGSVETVEVHITYDDLETDLVLVARDSILMP